MTKLKGKNIAVAIQGKLKKYAFEIGVFTNDKGRKPLKDLGVYAGGQVSKQSRIKGNVGVADLAKKLDKMYKWLFKPFRKKSNKEVAKVIVELQGDFNTNNNKKRLENALQAVVRNPILRKEYGHNALKTIEVKGFDRVMIRTGNFFKNIKARIFNKG